MLEVNVNGVKSEFVKSFSYRGITIDNKLQFNEHIKMRLGMQDTKYICYPESDTALIKQNAFFKTSRIIPRISQIIPRISLKSPKMVKIRLSLSYFQSKSPPDGSKLHI